VPTRLYVEVHSKVWKCSSLPLIASHSLDWSYRIVIPYLAGKRTIMASCTSALVEEEAVLNAGLEVQRSRAGVELASLVVWN